MKSLFALSLSCMVLSGCLATDPDSGVQGNQDSALPQDNGRVAGSSSSTNWPPEHGRRLVRVEGRVDSGIALGFSILQETAPFEYVPIPRKGVLRFYNGGLIPALKAPAFKEWRFPESDTVEIPASYLDSLDRNSKADTLTFNVHLESDSVQRWLMGFVYSRSQRKIIASPFSNLSATPIYIREPLWYLRGNLQVDSTILPPVPGNSELCFYIPGTPFFDRPKVGELDSIGPLPQGEYPLRLMRISRATPRATVTLVEAWEVHIANRSGIESFIPGAKVLSAEIQGVIDLRKAE